MLKNWLIRSGLENGITRVVLNNAPVNALTPEFLMDFADLLDEVRQDTSVKAIILASPFKVFSAGLDLKAAQRFDLADQQAIVAGLNIAFTKLFAFPKPVIAAVDGAAIAGGLFFVLGADYRLATERSSFGLAEVRVGADFPIGPLEIARTMLSANDARRLMQRGRPYTAEAALAAGIVDQIVAGDDLAKKAEILALEYADIPPKTFAKIKQQLRGGTIDLIEKAMADGANQPTQGWFNEETKAAMRAMIG